jgi:hypothetical protein
MPIFDLPSTSQLDDTFLYHPIPLCPGKSGSAPLDSLNIVRRGLISLPFARCCIGPFAAIRRHT